MWEVDGSLVNNIILPSEYVGVCVNTLCAVHCVQPHVVLKVLPLHANNICLPEKSTPNNIYETPKCATIHINPFVPRFVSHVVRYVILSVGFL